MRIGRDLAFDPSPVFEFELLDVTGRPSAHSFVVTSTADPRGTGEIVWVRCPTVRGRCFAPDQLPAEARCAEFLVGAWIFVSGVALIAGWSTLRPIVTWLRARNVAARRARA